MEIEILNPAVHVAIGDRLHSNSTIFINGSDVFLVEAMAAREDAEKLRNYVETELNKRVRFILCTNYFSDHMAALKVFPDAQIITHKDYSHTFAIEAFRSAEESDFFVEPHILVSDQLVIKWGDVTLNIFHNPSQTMTNLNIEVPEADLIIASDAVVGNIVYLRYSSMDVLNRALKRLQRAGLLGIKVRISSQNQVSPEKNSQPSAIALGWLFLPRRNCAQAQCGENF